MSRLTRCLRCGRRTTNPIYCHDCQRDIDNPAPTDDEVRQAIWATTPCTCTPRIKIRRHSHGRTKVQARHDPSCAIRAGHQQIRLEDDQ
jgi:hypothetical protein